MGPQGLWDGRVAGVERSEPPEDADNQLGPYLTHFAYSVGFSRLPGGLG